MKFIGTVGLAMLGMGLGFAQLQDPEKKNADQAKSSGVETTKAAGDDVLNSTDTFEPIDDMHHFMEMAWEPSHGALKESLKEEPQNRRVWREVKSHALILAETCAIVAHRVPEKTDAAKSKLWKEITVEVNQAGRELYKSAGKFPESRAAYEKMVDQCNRCHNEFENGRHQIEK